MYVTATKIVLLTSHVVMFLAITPQTSLAHQDPNLGQHKSSF